MDLKQREKSLARLREFVQLAIEIGEMQPQTRVSKEFVARAHALAQDGCNLLRVQPKGA